jgi:hypothetical protein
VYVYGYDGNPDDNFQVFWREQAPDFVLPFGEFFPDVQEPGLTNQEHFDRYGTSFAGLLLPDEAMERDRINGLVRPL